MSNVRSRPLHSAGAPLPRAWLDSAASPIRVFFGGIFLIWSWVSTVMVLGGILAPAFPGSAAGVPDQYLAAFGVAVLISVAEFVSAGRWPGAYWLTILLCDAPFTAWATRGWLLLLLSPYGDVTTAGQIAIGIVSMLGGIIAAILGELLLFGKRRD